MDLLNYNCIDFKKLLIIKAKSLKISDVECHILLIVMTMMDLHMKPINPQSISQFSSLTLKSIDTTLLSLLDKHLITRKNGKLDISPLYHLLINDEKKEVQEEVDLVSMFENAFARGLNQIELDIISSFKSSGYDDAMILDALNEAVKSNVLNFRYIEKILDNWSKYGVKKRFAPMNNEVKEQVDESIKDYKWW